MDRPTCGRKNIFSILPSLKFTGYRLLSKWAGSISSHQIGNGEKVGLSVTDCFGRSNSENREGIYAAIRAYRGKTRFSMEGFEDFRAVMGEAIPGPGPCSTYVTRFGKMCLKSRKQLLRYG